MSQGQKSELLTKGQMFNILFKICLGHQRAITVPLRNHYGVLALGWPCVWAVMLILLWAALSNDVAMFAWLAIWFVYFVMRRVEAVRLNLSGAKVHSQYDGYPTSIRYGRTEKMTKLILEPLLVGIFGGLLYVVYTQYLRAPPYGLPYFFMLGSASMLIVELVKLQIWSKRKQDLLDTRLEQESIMEEYRQKYGDT